MAVRRVLTSFPYCSVWQRLSHRDGNYLYALPCFQRNEYLDPPMEQNRLEPPHPRREIYPLFAIYIATLVGGPLAAGYLVAEDYKVLNDTAKVRATWLITFIAFVIMVVLALYLPENAPNFV